MKHGMAHAIHDANAHRVGSNSRLRTGRMISDPNTSGLNHPETGVDPLRRQCTNRVVEAREVGANRLIGRPKHDDAWGPLGVVAPGVGEVGIERDEDASFAVARRLNRRIDRAREALIMHIVHVPSSVDEAPPS